MATVKDDRRGAERYSPPKPVPATFGGFESKILDISLVGCRIEHTDRLTPRARLALKFAWRGGKVKIDATVIRSELTSIGGKPAYISGLEFCASPDDSPAVVRDIVGFLAGAAKKSEPAAAAPPPPPPPEEEAELLSAKYLQCTLARGQWMKVYVDKPAQPSDGFTILAPANDSEADLLCRAYQQADASKRQTMRASFQRQIAGK